MKYARVERRATAQDKRTRATLFLHQHPKPETVTPELLVSVSGCDEAWAKYLVAGRAGQ